MYEKKSARIRRSGRIRHKFKELRVIRLVVHRTSRHIYAQIIASDNTKVLAYASTVEKKISQGLKYTGNKDSAATVGRIIAERALDKGIKSVSFDRSGFKYHGRIKVLADAARKAGLSF